MSFDYICTLEQCGRKSYAFRDTTLWYRRLNYPSSKLEHYDRMSNASRFKLEHYSMLY